MLSTGCKNRDLDVEEERSKLQIVGTSASPDAAEITNSQGGRQRFGNVGKLTNLKDLSTSPLKFKKV